MDIEVLQDDSATCEQATPAATSRGRVAVAGLGNIGSFTADLLARMPEVKHLTLIDYQSYESSNLASQHIAAAAIGRPKARVVATRLQAIRSDLRVEPLVMDLRHVPLAKLQVDVLCACLDSRLARLVLNDIALALGVPWVDAGVEPSSLLARVNTYRPGPAEPCYACALSPEDYRHLEVTYPCSRDRSAAPPTNAPASLGALAASLHALEVAKVLRGQWPLAAIGRQITIAAGAHQHYVTRLPVNLACRSSHTPWTIHPGLAADWPLQRVAAAWPDATLSLPGQTWVRQLACSKCAFRTRTLPLGILSGRLPVRRQKCPRCAAPLHPVGFSQADALPLSELPPLIADSPLAALGLVDGDIVTLRHGDDERHILLGHQTPANEGSPP